MSIPKILEGKNGDIVTLTAFIAIDENRPPVPTKFRKTGTILNKAEYPFNGDTENIKLTVRGAEIKEIKSRSMHIITKCYYQ